MPSVLAERKVQCPSMKLSKDPNYGFRSSSLDGATYSSSRLVGSMSNRRPMRLQFSFGFLVELPGALTPARTATVC